MDSSPVGGRAVEEDGRLQSEDRQTNQAANDSADREPIQNIAGDEGIEQRLPGIFTHVCFGLTEHVFELLFRIAQTALGKIFRILGSWLFHFNYLRMLGPWCACK